MARRSRGRPINQQRQIKRITMQRKGQMANSGLRVRGSGFKKPAMVAALALCGLLAPATIRAEGKRDQRVEHVVSRGLEWVANTQSRLGSWTAVENRYPTAMTALAGIALLQEGS